MVPAMPARSGRLFCFYLSKRKVFSIASKIADSASESQSGRPQALVKDPGRVEGGVSQPLPFLPPLHCGMPGDPPILL